jgi:pimeloyl-ACP methyl ester carboxylesterase
MSTSPIVTASHELPDLDAGRGVVLTLIPSGSRSGLLSLICEELGQRGMRMVSMPSHSAFHGGVSQTGAGHPPQVFSRQIVRSARAHGSPVTLLAMGAAGHTALESGLLAPELFQRLVLVAPEIPSEHAGPSRHFARFLSLRRRSHPAADDVRADGACAYDFWGRLRSLMVPSLFVWSEQDLAEIGSRVDRVAKLVPAAEHIASRCVTRALAGPHSQCLARLLAELLAEKSRQGLRPFSPHAVSMRP